MTCEEHPRSHGVGAPDGPHVSWEFDMRLYLLTAASALALFAAAPASATVIITTGAGVIQPEENLLFTNNPANGLTVDGVTNQTDTFVSISGGETLVGNGGQARVEAADAFLDTAFTYNGLAGQTLGFDLSDNELAFTQAEFRLFVGKGDATEATLTFFDTTGGQFQETFAIPANGYFNAYAIDGQLIDYFSFSANGSIEDVRQVRLGGVGGLDGGGGGAGVVPEPGTWALMILGFGGAGTVLRAQRRRRATA